MRQHSGAGRPRRRLCRGDGGFTLIELTVTMVIVGTVLLALVAVQTRALVTTTDAKQRQQATAVGNMVMEQLRSLPFDALDRGMNPAAASTDPHITGGRFRPSGSTIDEVPVAGGSGVTTLPPLAGPGGTNLTTVTDTATSSVTFAARAYTTREPAATAGSPLWLSVVVTWSSSVTRGTTRTAVFRSRAFAPDGCLSTTNRPFSGPCQAFLYGDAAVGPGSISVSHPDGTSPVLPGAAATAVDLTLVQAGAGIASEQTDSVQGRVVSSGSAASEGEEVASTEGGVALTTAAGDDVGAGASRTSTADLSQATADLTVSGTFATLTAAASPSDSGRSTSTASAAAGECADLDGTAMVAQPCAGSRVRPAGAARVTLDLSALGGRDLAPFDLGRVAAPPSATTADATAWVGRYVDAPGSARCVVLTGAGCVSAGAARYVGTTTVGTLPPSGPGDAVVAPAAMVEVSGYSDRVVTESGASSTGVAPSLARSGTVRFWNGSSTTTFPLSATTDRSDTLGTATGTYVTSGSGPLTVTVTGSLTVKPRVTTSTTPDARCTMACTREATMPSVRVVLSYAVSLAGAPLATFDVVGDLGSSIASTSYQAAPVA